jgi:DNA polymerase-3 subunit delta
MTLDDLRAELEADQVRCSYLVVGAEPLLRDDALEAIRTAVLAGSPSDFDYERLDGGTVTPAALLDAVRTLPVLASRRLIVLREPEVARARARGLTDAIGEALAALKDSRDTVLVVLAEKVDGRSRWVRAFGSAAVVRCDPPRKHPALRDFIAAEANRHGRKSRRPLSLPDPAKKSKRSMLRSRRAMSPKNPSGSSPTRSEKGVAVTRWPCSGNCCVRGARRLRF